MNNEQLQSGTGHSAKQLEETNQMIVELTNLFQQHEELVFVGSWVPQLHEPNGEKNKRAVKWFPKTTDPSFLTIKHILESDGFVCNKKHCYAFHKEIDRNGETYSVELEILPDACEVKSKKNHKSNQLVKDPHIKEMPFLVLRSEEKQKAELEIFYISFKTLDTKQGK